MKNETILKKLTEYTNTNEYKLICEIVIGLHENIAIENNKKRNISKDQLSAFNKLIKRAMSDIEIHPSLGGWWKNKEDKQCICDGYSCFILNNFIDSPYKLEDNIEPLNLNTYFKEEISNMFNIKLQTINELNAKLKIFKAEKNIKTYVIKINNQFFNIEYLINAMKLLDTQEIFMDNDAQFNLIYFVSDKGKGVLLPLRVDDDFKDYIE